MIALSTAYSLWFLVHLVTAFGTVFVLVAMRFTALSVLEAPDPATQRQRLPDRTNIAARVVHLTPITGVIVSWQGPPDVALQRPWVVTGIVLYVALAAWLEVKILPDERRVAQTLGASSGSLQSDVAGLVRRIDVALTILALILLTMVVQF